MSVFKKTAKDASKEAGVIIGNQMSQNMQTATNVAVDGMRLFQDKVNSSIIQNGQFEFYKGNLFEYIEAAKFNTAAARAGSQTRAVVTDELHSGAITSGGTMLEEVRAADENPVGYAKAFERKQMLGEMKASATNMAKASFVTTGIVSGVTNMFEVFKNEKDLADAFHDVGADAVKGAVRGGATGVISTAIMGKSVSPIVPLAVYTTASYVFAATREIIKNAN